MATAAEQLEDWLCEACILEATARKPGNVHPEATFCDVEYGDLVKSAETMAPALAATRELGLGAAVLDATSRTATLTPANTNLGMILLLAPLAAVHPNVNLADGLAEVLAHTTVEDARLVYRAIRLANPGGLGRVSEQDVHETPSVTLTEAMCLAADRDRIAAQYATGFRDVLGFGVPRLLDWSRRSTDWEQAVVGLHLTLMSALPDTLIARKCGTPTADEASRQAQGVLAAGWPENPDAHRQLEDFDRWLRADAHRRNPGTTADLVAATLFVVLRDHRWQPRPPTA